MNTILKDSDEKNSEDKNDTNLPESPRCDKAHDLSSRLSSRSDFKGAKGQETRGDFKKAAADSFPFQGDSAGLPPREKTPEKDNKNKKERTPIILDMFSGSKADLWDEQVFLSEDEMISRKRLIQIEKKLSARDRAVLQALQKYKYLTSDQIARLYVRDFATKTSQTRVTQLMLKHLADNELIRPFERRVGGRGGGSSMPVWHLTNAGSRLLSLNDPSGKIHKGFKEPSSEHMEHTLSIAECAVQMICLARYSHDLSVEKIETEPTCWRRFSDYGQVYDLRPDMYAVTSNDNNEDLFFIEIDLGTESVPTVLRKCDTYVRYYYSNVEQEKNEAFPLVVWIVKDQKRKETLKEAIHEKFRLHHSEIFIVITPDELEKLMREGYTGKDLG